MDLAMSAFPSEADIRAGLQDVCFVPRTEVADAVAASLRKPCFAEAVDIQPKPQYIAAPYPFRNAKIGFEFEQIGHCLPCLCFAS
jgi:hypothetical protein